MMGFPKYDSGFCFDAASAPDRERLAGPAVDAPPASWSNPTTSEVWDGPDKGNAVETWKDANGYDGGVSTGTKATNSPAAGVIVAGTPATITDVAGLFVANMVGGTITISAAANPLNNGQFIVTGYISATQLEYHNPDAVNTTEALTWATNVADAGYGAVATPTTSWRFDVDLPAGWYTRSTTSKKHSGQQ